MQNEIFYYATRVNEHKCWIKFPVLRPVLICTRSESRIAQYAASQNGHVSDETLPRGTPIQYGHVLDEKRTARHV